MRSTARAMRYVRETLRRRCTFILRRARRANSSRTHSVRARLRATRKGAFVRSRARCTRGAPRSNRARARWRGRRDPRGRPRCARRGARGRPTRSRRGSRDERRRARSTRGDSADASARIDDVRGGDDRFEAFTVSPRARARRAHVTKFASSHGSKNALVLTTTASA